MNKDLRAFKRLDRPGMTPAPVVRGCVRKQTAAAIPRHCSDRTLHLFELLDTRKPHTYETSELSHNWVHAEAETKTLP
jgi:hypothetical protein